MIMKRIFFIFIAVLIFISNSQSQNSDILYFLNKENSMLKIGHFNKTYTPSGYTQYKIEKVTETDSSKILTMSIVNFDKFNKPFSFDTINVVKQKSFLKIDPEFLISDQNISFKENIISGREIVFPAILSTGMGLSSAWIEFHSKEKYLKISEFSRMVDKFEKIKTLNYSFDACLISSKYEIQSDEQSKNVFYTVEKWYAPELGPVRINYYNNKRKLVKFSEVVDYFLPEDNL